jgi:outer membrane protein TolC
LRRILLAAVLSAGGWFAPGFCPAQTAERVSMPCASNEPPKTVEFRDVLVAALDQQPQLLIARAEVDKARANLTAALTPFLPALTASFVDERFVPSGAIAPVTVVGNEVIGGTQTYSGYGSIGLNWNLFSSGKDVAGYRGAKAGSRSSRAALESQLDDTFTGLLQAYGDLFDAQRSVLEQRRTSALLREMQTRAEERLAHGDGTTIAVEQASNKASESERSLFQACHAVATKSSALAKQAGMQLPPGFLLTVGAPLPALDADRAGHSPDGTDAVLDHDPSVIAARENVTVAEAKLRQAKAAYGPTISLFGRRDYLGQDPSGLSAANHNIAPESYRIGIQVQQPILPLTSESSAVSSARAELREAQAKYSQAIRDAESRGQESWATLQETAAAALQARTVLESSQHLLALTESLYKAGRTDLDDLQSARINVEKQQSLLERTASDLLVANWAWYRAQRPSEFASTIAGQLHVDLYILHN